MATITSFLREKSSVQAVFSAVGKRQTQLITGIAGSARALFLSSLLKEKQQQYLVKEKSHLVKHLEKQLEKQVQIQLVGEKQKHLMLQQKKQLLKLKLFKFIFF